MTQRSTITLSLGRALSAVVLTGSLLTSGAACDKGKNEVTADDAKTDDKGTKDPTSVGKVLKVKFEDVRGMVKKGKPISAAQYRKLVLAHANCKVTQQGIDGKCEAVKIMSASMNRSQLAKGALGGNRKLGAELLGHESPAVRIKAAQMMGSLFGTKKNSQSMIVKALETEKVPAVMKAMIRTVRNDGARNPAVGKMLLAMADHDNPMIRKEAIFGLSSSWNKKLAGGPEKLIAMMQGDKDKKVRQTACEYAGGLGDEKLFPVYKKLLENRDDGGLWGDCFEGLVSMWADYPLYGTANKDAYALTMQLLNATPRTAHIPPWTVMSEFGHLGKEDNDKLKKWQANATWFSKDDLIKALLSVTGDSNAKWMTRTGATKALVSLGAKKADLEKIRKTLGDAPKGTDSHVAKELDKAIAATK